MEDGLIEIDPELYMTCRLCVERKGKFQILPNLQKRIKYAFDIDVELFDGFSQIMCEKCKADVMMVSAMKETFQTKQADLRGGKLRPATNLEIDDAKVVEVKVAEPASVLAEPQENGQCDSDVSMSTFSKEKSSFKKRKKAKKKKKRLKIASSSSSENNVIQSESQSDRDDTADKNIVQSKSQSWKDFYRHTYVCRYCYKHLTFKKSMRDHVQTHNQLVKLRHRMTRWHSVVRMERFDDRPNLTGTDDVVVLSQIKLCTNTDSADYFIMYTPKVSSTDLLVHKSSDEKDTDFMNCNSINISDGEGDSRSKQKVFTCIDVTSDEDETPQPKLRKRIRLQSSDSVDTVDLQVDDRPDSASDTMNVEESSNDVPEPSRSVDCAPEPIPTDKRKRKRKKSEKEYNIIMKIVSASLENINKKSAKVSSLNKENMKRKLSIEELTNRKLLSIGRKTMFKRGFMSMGLLKVLEQKNIKIDWVKDGPSKDSMVRILTKLSTAPNILSGFKQCEENEEEPKETESERILRTVPWISVEKLAKPIGKLKSKVAAHPTALVVSPLIPSASILPPATSVPAAALLPPATAVPTAPLLPALPHTTLTRNVPAPACTTTTDPPVNPLLLNLLNASPVANPKMAPKKKVLKVLLKPEPSNKVTQNDHDYNGEPILLDSDEDSATGMSMPSISPPPLKENNIEPLSISSSNADFSRFKFIQNTSSASDMCMPIITATTSLANLPQDESIKDAAEETVNTVPRIKCKPVSELMGAMTKLQYANSAIPFNSTDQSTVHENDKNGRLKTSLATPTSIPPGHVILHTITLPNTVTKSPFDYFGKLLRMHTLYLLDRTSHPEIQFANLVKFKLGVHQHPLSVMLCLTLEAHGRMFRIAVRNKANDDVDIGSMTALWQWEVIKAFNSASVIARIKQAAEKEVSVTVNHTNLFVGLLNSIKLIVPNSYDTRNDFKNASIVKVNTG